MDPAATMHPPIHEDILPDHVPPMVMPDTRTDARLLLLCLKTGYFPTYENVTQPDSTAEVEMLAKAA